MTRKIERNLIDALKEGKERWKERNTLLENNCIFLHGNCIGSIESEPYFIRLVLNTCDLNTRTTCSRLNAILYAYDLHRTYKFKLLKGLITLIDLKALDAKGKHKVIKPYLLEGWIIQTPFNFDYVN